MQFVLTAWKSDSVITTEGWDLFIKSTLINTRAFVKISIWIYDIIISINLELKCLSGNTLLLLYEASPLIYV